MRLSFLEYMSVLPDPRIDGMVIYPLPEILLSALVGVVCGGDDWEEVALCAEAKLSFLRRYFPFEQGVASSQTFRRVFRALDSAAFGERFLAWVSGLSGALKGIVAIDGKTLRGSKRSPCGAGALHLLSAFAHEAGLVVGQKAVDGKSNEITAVPALLEQLALEGAIVTLDAMGAQRNIAQAIIARGADYIVALKGNQGTLHEDVALFFKEHSGTVAWQSHEEADAGHGRVEERHCLATADIAWLNDRHGWPGLRSVVRVNARRTDKRTRASTEESRYYLSSLPPDPAYLLAGIRAHWSIENTLHWSLDVTFKDDLCRSRKDHAALNFAIIKHSAFNLLKQSTEAIALKNKRKKAGWDTRFLKKCLGL